MQKKTIVTCAIIFLVFAVYYYLLPNEKSVNVEIDVLSASALELFLEKETEIIPLEKTIDLPQAQKNLSGTVSPQVSIIATQFYTVSNYHSFVNEYLEAAVNGSAEAQYYIYKALNECKRLATSKYHASEQAFEGFINSDQIYAMSYFQREGLREQYNLCKDFVGEDLETLYGDPYGWLEKSFKSNYSPAIVESANVTVLESAFPGLYLKTKKGSNKKRKLSSEKTAELRKRVLSKTLKSLRLSEPEAILRMSNSFIEFPNYNFKETMSAWVLLACKQGLPCDEGARWRKHLCDSADCNISQSVKPFLVGIFDSGTVENSEEIVTKIERAIETGDWSELSPKFRKLGR